MRDDLPALASELDAEPLARIMAGHRELFHSNLIGWFFEALPAVADRVFPSSLPGPGSPREAVRELQNLDLVLVRPDVRPLVVENKVFSVPTRAQLAEYDVKLARWWDVPARRVLLSMAQTNPPLPSLDPVPDPTRWVFWSHAEFADRLEDELRDEGSSYEVDTMRRYARVLRLLHRMIDATRVVDDSEPVFLDPAVTAAIRSRQIRQGLEKMRAEHVATWIGRDADGLTADSSMTRGMPIVTIRRATPDDADFREVSVQLQEGQVRKLLVVQEHLQGRGVAARAAREEVAAGRPDAMTLAPIHRALGTGDADERAGFKHFDPDSIYRYVKGPGITLAQLRDIRTML